MCIILFAINSHPDYPFVVAANRDEFYARPTKKLIGGAITPMFLVLAIKRMFLVYRAQRLAYLKKVNSQLLQIFERLVKKSRLTNSR